MSKFNFIFNGIGVDATATFKGNTNTAFGDGMMHPKFYVYLKTSSDRTRFTFHGSYYDYKNGVQELNEKEMLEAIDCFFSDALAYDNARSFEDFCEEFGYTEISQYKQAKKAYDGCKRSHDAAIRLFGDYYYEALDEVREQMENL